MPNFRLTGPGGGKGLAKSLQRQFREKVRHKIVQSGVGGGGATVKMTSNAQGPVVTALRRIAKETLQRSRKNLRRDWKVGRQSSKIRESNERAMKKNGLAFFLPMDRKAVESGVNEVLGTERISKYQKGQSISIRFGYTSNYAELLESGVRGRPISDLPRFPHPRNRRSFAAWLDTFPETRNGFSAFFTSALKKGGRRAPALDKKLMRKIGEAWRKDLRKYVKK